MAKKAKNPLDKEVFIYVSDYDSDGTPILSVTTELEDCADSDHVAIYTKHREIEVIRQYQVKDR